jgi:two-component system sensor histidine kinase/response regulator
MKQTKAPKSPRLIVVDDEGALLEALCTTLRHAGYDTTGFRSAKAALAALEGSRFDLMLCDLRMPEMEGIALLRAARQIDPDLAGIIITGQGTIDTAIEAMKAGALDYILKPFKLTNVLPALERGLAMRKLRIENAALQRRVKERTADLEAMNRELEAFAYSISHDLRAPVRAVSGFANFLKQDFAKQLPPEAVQLVDVISGSATQMGRMIDSLLELSRMGRHLITQKPVDMASLVAEIVADLNRTSVKHARVEVGTLGTCFGDPYLLRQVWVNLVSNALKFTSRRKNAHVEIGGREEAGRTVYFVRDNGAGFDARYAERLFAPFRRLHGAEFEGHGIGLSIVKRIVERHGGRVWAESKLDRGATFYFTINVKGTNSE